MYALDKNDAHHLIADEEDLRLVCVFLPSLKGDEIHDIASKELSSAY